MVNFNYLQLKKLKEILEKSEQDKDIKDMLKQITTDCNSMESLAKMLSNERSILKQLREKYPIGALVILVRDGNSDQIEIIGLENEHTDIEKIRDDYSKKPNRIKDFCIQSWLVR